MTHLLNVLDLHAVLVHKRHPLLSKQVACVMVHDTLNLGISLNDQGFCLLQPLLTCIQDLLVFLCSKDEDTTPAMKVTSQF